MGSVRIPNWHQGPTGSGQGGWTAWKLVEIIGQPATIAIKASIPLETDMNIVALTGGQKWQLVDNSGPISQVILEAERWDPDFADITPVSVADATEARSRFPLPGDLHPVPFCFSCGQQPDSMNVHPGRLDDGRFATDWRVPDWAVHPDGAVDPGPLWSALDCTAAFYVNCEPFRRQSFTVQYAVEIAEDLDPSETYALVASAGDNAPDWDGRKRGAASAAFGASGNCVARARSFWVAVE